MEEKKTIEIFLKTYHIHYLTYDSKMMRSSDYRERFFKIYPPIWKDYYICSYCGKLIPKDKVTVDHIISIRKAQKSKIIPFLLGKYNIKDINDPKNLCAACQKCNLKKGQRVNLIYVIQGMLGKSRKFWIMYYGLIFTLIIIGIWILVFKI